MIANAAPPERAVFAAPPRRLETGNPFRFFGFAVSQIYLFLLLSRVSEFLDRNGRAHLVLLSAALAILLSLIGMTVADAFRHRIGVLLALFSGWLVFEIPFSSWKGGSVHGLLDSWLKSYLTYVVLVALIRSLGHLRKSFHCVALATGVIVLLSFKFGMNAEVDGRFAFGGGTLANANDLAMQLLIGLPFLVWIGGDRKRNLFLRIPALLVVPVLLYFVLKTGSRAGLIAAAVMCIMFFFRTTGGNRLMLAVAGCVLLFSLPFLLPQDIRERYSTLLTGTKVTNESSEVVKSAALSQEGRTELIKHAFILTAENPLFGVGLYQFPAASAQLSIRNGEPPMWFPAHSFLLLVMAETGIPGVILYTAALFYCLKTILSISRRTKRHQELVMAGEVSDVLLYSFIGFVVCMSFSPSAYLFHFPMMAAFVTVLDNVTRQKPELRRDQSRPESQQINSRWYNPRQNEPRLQGSGF